MRNPLVSIIFSAYNSEKNLKPTIESVMAQNFSDFEFIIIDDASADSTPQIISDFAKRDSRIVLLRNDTNAGLTKSLNKGLGIAKGAYIARIDAGDRWEKTKLSKQVKFLDENPDYVICATQSLIIREGGDIVGQPPCATDNASIKINFFTREGIFSHPSILFRNNGVRYRDFFKYSQDLDLYMRLSFQGKFYCLPEPLTYSKLSPTDLTIKRKYYQRQYANIIYRLLNERIRSGKKTDSLDEGRKYRTKETKIGLFLCQLAGYPLFKYSETKSRGEISWIFWLIAASFIYPPFFKDYCNKFFRIMIYKKLKLIKRNEDWLDRAS